MEIELINQRHFEKLPSFKKTVIRRDYDVLILVVSGGYSVLPSGEKKPMIIGEYEIAFIPAGVEFFRATVEPPTYYFLSFRSDVEHPFRRGLPTGKLNIPMEQRLPIFNALERAFLIPDNRELMLHLIERIFVEKYLFDKSRTLGLPHVSEAVIDTVQYMNSNLNKRLDMEELAARVYLSHTGFIWKFKRELGTTPSQYLILLRLKYAKQLLLNYSYNITEISEMCGYTNPYYFTNAFRRYSGMSPTEFRKHYSDGGIEGDEQ